MPLFECHPCVSELSSLVPYGGVMKVAILLPVQAGKTLSEAKSSRSYGNLCLRQLRKPWERLCFEREIC